MASCPSSLPPPTRTSGELMRASLDIPLPPLYKGTGREELTKLSINQVEEECYTKERKKERKKVGRQVGVTNLGFETMEGVGPSVEEIDEPHIGAQSHPVPRGSQRSDVKGKGTQTPLSLLWDAG